MRAALVIAGKDLRERIRDRSAILILAIPLALAAIFSQTLSGVTSDSVTFEYALVDLDGGPVARSFRDELLRPLEADGLVELTPADSVAEGRRLAENGDVAATFVLPSGFSRAVSAGRKAELEVVGNVDAPTGTLVARSVAESFANELTSIQTAVATVVPSGAAIDPSEAGELASRAAASARPVEIEDVSATRKELEPTTFYAAGMAVFFLFFTVQFGISSLLDERREGTLRRLLAAPISRSAILWGKLLTSFVLGIVSMGILVGATSLILGAAWGDPVGVAVLIVVGVLAATAVMALVATFAKTPEQAGNWQAMVALVLGMLGGAFFPVAQAGGLVEQLSLLTPHAWFLRGLSDLQGGGGVADILPAVSAILVFVGVTGGIAFARLSKLVEP